MPLRNIRAVQIGRVRSQGGRQPALIVDFIDVTSGIEDQVGIVLREPQYWKGLIIDENIQKSKQL